MLARNYSVLFLCFIICACASNPSRKQVAILTPRTDMAGQRYGDCLGDGIKKYWRSQETAGDVADAVLAGCDSLLRNFEDVEGSELMQQAPSASARRYLPSTVSSSVQRLRKDFRGDIINKIIALRYDASKPSP